MKAESSGNTALSKMIMRVALKFQADVLSEAEAQSWVDRLVEMEGMGSFLATLEATLTSVLPRVTGDKRTMWTNVRQYFLDRGWASRIVTNLLIVKYPLDDDFLWKMLEVDFAGTSKQIIKVLSFLFSES